MRCVCSGLVWVMYTGQGCCGRHCCNSCTNEGGDKCRLRAASQQQTLAYVYGGVAQEGGLGAGQYAEIGPYHVVKNMLLQCGDGGRQGMYRHRGVALSAYGVEHQRQRSNMVEVAVAEQDMVDAQHLLDRQVAHAGASIDQDVLIEQKRGGAASLSNCP